MDNHESYKYYFPYSFSKDNNFLKYYKHPNQLADHLLGKNEFHTSEQWTGFSRKLIGVSNEEKLRREYIWKEFRLWKDWFESGKNIISFSNELLRMLQLTDVNDVELDSLQLPYNNFYLSLKSLTIPFSDEVSLLIDGVYINKELNPDKEEDEGASYDYVINFNFAGNYEALNIKYGDSISEIFDYNIKNFTLALDKRLNIFNVSEGIKDHLNFFKEGIVTANQELKNEIFNTHSNLVEKTIRIVINCLLYLSLPDKEIEKIYSEETPKHLLSRLKEAKTKRKKKIAELDIKELGFTKINFAGKSFRGISFNKTNALGEVTPHWRRGHWRNQKLGERLSNSKLIWIRPTIVNKENGMPQKGHIYSVD